MLGVHGFTQSNAGSGKSPLPSPGSRCRSRPPGLRLLRRFRPKTRAPRARSDESRGIRLSSSLRFLNLLLLTAFFLHSRATAEARDVPGMSEREKRMIPKGTSWARGSDGCARMACRLPRVRAFETSFNDLCAVCQDGTVCVILAYPTGPCHRCSFLFRPLGDRIRAFLRPPRHLPA
jgi:hypothetical protein